MREQRGYWHRRNGGQRPCGYFYWVSLLSREGVVQTKYVSGRRSWRDGTRRVFVADSDRTFCRLLSAGWKVISQERADELEAEREEQKKNTALVIGTTQTGDQSHGGEHASQEVEDSPNRAKRGCRGGRSKKAKEEKRRNKQREKHPPLQLNRCSQRTGSAVYAAQPLRTNPALLASSEASAKLLMQLVGRSEARLQRGVIIDSARLVTALEIGDDPLPALETPDERPRLRILVTPDCSGSTQNWSGLGQAWATHLATMPDIDVVYLQNVNGDLIGGSMGVESRALIERADLVLYLGDGDGYELCRQYAAMGATVIGLDTYCANVANPRCKTELIAGGTLHWVDRVSAKIPDTWHRAIARCL